MGCGSHHYYVDEVPGLPRHYSAAPLQKTLGYFLQGIPVVFLEIEVALRSHPELRAYLDFLKKCEEEDVKDPILSPDLCLGYERFATFVHEFRHFHDGLLCTPLFEMFLVRNEVSWCIAQLVSRTPLGVNRIPLDWHDPRLATVGDLSFLKETIFGSDELYFRRYPTLYDSYTLLNAEVNLDYLIETNAIVAELLQLYSVHGMRSVWSYYQHTIMHLEDQKYTLLITSFERLYGDLLAAITALYFVIPFCLFSSPDPTRTFCEIVKQYQTKPRAMFELCNPANLRYCFRNESVIEDYVDKLTLVNRAGPIHIKLEELGQFAKGLMHFHRTMYRCRKQLINTYIGEFEYRADLYFERMGELPIPPILFYPDVSVQGTVKGVPEQEFRTRNLPLYKIAAWPSNRPEGEIVLAGMTSLPGSEPAVTFDVADMQLVYAYFYRAAFQGETSFYTPVVDHMYEQLLREASLEKTTE
jgi:hypothetical protein